jgi:hypothetical protein
MPQCFCGMAFSVMFQIIALQRNDDPFRLGARRRRVGNRIALGIYGLAAVVALSSPPGAIVLVTVASLAYVAPHFLDAQA